jgi:hypothetical protein
MDYQTLGNGRYRLFGPGFWADVHMYHNGTEWVCIVERCNNHMVNPWDIQLWCVANIN